MEKLAQIAETLHPSQPPDGDKDAVLPPNGTTLGHRHANGDGFPFDQLSSPDGYKPAPAQSAPGSPSTKHNPFPRSTSLASPATNKPPPRGDTAFIDPLSSEFVRHDSQFRSAWSYKDPDSESSRRPSKRRGSWTGGAGSPSRSGTGDDSGGMWRRWVEIPLGLVPDPNEEGDASTTHHEGQNGDTIGPRTSSPEPQDSPHTSPDPLPPADRPADEASPSRQGSGGWPLPDPLKFFGISRTRSMPHMNSRKGSKAETQESPQHDGGDEPPTAGTTGGKGWAVLKNRLSTLR